MGALAVSWLVLIGIGGIVQPGEMAWIVILGLYSIGVGFLLVVGAGWMYLALILGFIFRLALLWADLYTDIPVFSSGGDTENFYMTALAIYNNPELFGTDLYGGVFPQLCGALFWVIGPSKLFVQYGNVILSIIAFMFVGLSMKRLRVPERIAKPVLLICCLMPIPAAISSIFLRESLILCLVAASFYAFTRWVTNGSVISVLLAVALVSAAATLHLGVLGLLCGYGFALLFFDRQRAIFSFTMSNLVLGLPIVLATTFVIVRFPGLFLEKLDKISSTEDAIAMATGSSAGSAYLTGVSIDNPVEFILFSTLKGFFLLTSPLPMDWRGIGDIVSFALDGIFYLIAFVVAFGAYRGRKKSHRRRIQSVVLVGLVSAVLVLGVGTGAAGTAMRHRQKMLPVIAVSVALSLAIQRERRWSIESLSGANVDSKLNGEGKR